MGKRNVLPEWRIGGGKKEQKEEKNGYCSCKEKSREIEGGGGNYGVEVEDDFERKIW